MAADATRDDEELDDEDGEDEEDDAGTKLLEQARRVLAKHENNAESSIVDAMKDAYRARKGKRNVLRQMAELKKKLPEGSVVLTGKDAEAYKALQAQNLSLDRVKETVEENAAVKRENAAIKHDQVVAEAAGALKWNPRALKRLVASDALHVELKPETVTDRQGKQTTVQVPYVRLASDEKATPVKLAEYVEAQAADVKPALMAGTGTTGMNGGPAGAPPHVLPHQGSASAGSDRADSVQEFVNQRNAQGASRSPVFGSRGASTGNSPAPGK